MKLDLVALDKHSTAWSSVVGRISHGLITKLATLRMKHQSLQDVLPSLLTGYRLAVEQNLMEGKLTEEDLSSLDDTTNLEEQITPMMHTLESLNAYCAQLRSDSSALELVSARSYINELLSTYPFENDVQRHQVQFEPGSDFNFQCSLVFMNALLENLLSNGLMSVETAKHGDIRIWITKDDNFHTINIKDTGLGMTDRACTRVYGHVLSLRNDQMLPGLGFCRLAIQHIGGDITCDTVNGEYTHFQIMFPQKTH